MIVCAAIMDGNGRIWLGKRHCDCFFLMSRFKVNPKDHKQGFVTENGTFLNRRDSYVQARAGGQVKEDKSLPPRDLFSEGLY